MRILFDNQIFYAQRFGGISRYFCELIKGVERKDGVVVDYHVGYTNNIHFNEAGLVDGVGKYLPAYDFPGKKLVVKTSSILKNVQQVFEMKKHRFDVFVPTYYNPKFLNHIKDKPFVLTVYDMIHELFPQYFVDDSDDEIANKRLLIQKAEKIIAISESTKRDILKIYPDTKEAKIEVVYLSHSIHESQPLKSMGLPEKYLLFIGKRGGYKNFKFFLDAAIPVLNEDKLLKLVCTGPTFSEDEYKLFAKHDIQDQLIHINAADDELKTLYSNATVFVFPSEYEGFGIPILEAMASGCPVIVSNASSFPEVAGEAAIYFELNDLEGLREAINIVVYSQELQVSLKEKGHAQVKKFSWDKTAEECLEVFKKAVVQHA